MNPDEDFDQTLETWLRREAPPQAPDRVLHAALERVAVQSQRPGWLHFGGTPMTVLIRVVAVAAVVAFVAFIGYQISTLPPNVGGSPSPSAGATGSQTPAPTDASADPSRDPAVGTLVLRLNSAIGFSGINHVVTVVDDGRIISTDDREAANPFVERRLTPAGIQLLRDELEGTGLTDASATYKPVPKPGVDPPGRGSVVHTLTVGVPAGGTAVINWVAIYDDDALYYEPSPERETLDALAVRLQTLDDWLPANAWADMTAAPYVPARHYMLIEKVEWGGTLDELPVESSAVAWPLSESIDDFGEPTESPALGRDSARCGVISADEATAVIAALEAARATPDEHPWTALLLGERANNLVVRITSAPAMPDETTCDAGPLQ